MKEELFFFFFLFGVISLSPNSPKTTAIHLSKTFIEDFL